MRFTFLGIVQGVTEFLPVSSSGHLFFLQKALNLEGDYLPFFVFLHLATLLTIIVFFYKRIKLLFKIKLLLNLALITLISAVMGLGIKFYLKEFLGGKFFLSFCFLANAAVLLTIRPDSGNREVQDMSIRDCFYLGFLQGFSPLPGISRSGITIAALLRRGFKRSQAFIFSFFMAIPLIIGAFAIEFKDLKASNLPWQSLGAGFSVAFVSGLFALSITSRALKTGKLKNFAYYSLLAALVALIV